MARHATSICGWALAGLMLAAVGLRLFEPDGATFVIAVEAALPWVLLPSLPLAVAAAVFRRYVLSGLAAVSLVFGGVWELPVMWPFATAPAADPSALIKLFDANIAQDNSDPTGIAAEIRADRPDVVALQELTPRSLRSLERSGVLAPYRWSAVAAEYGPGGVGLWSDLPTADLQTWSVGDGQAEAEGLIDPGHAPPVWVDCVHVFAPIGPGQPARWDHELEVLRQHLAVEPRPLIVAGDFNATADTGPFGRILGLSLRDAATMAGKGWEMTWPRNQAWVIPYLRLDHVLLSPALTVAGYHLGVGHGSDHHPLEVVVGYKR